MMFLKKFYKPLLSGLNQELTQKDALTFNFSEIIRKIICFILIIACIGLPVIKVPGFVIIFISGLLIVTGKIKGSFKQLGVVFLIAIAVISIKGILPHAALQEGHNIFFTKGNNEVLERQLPPEVFGFMKQEFLKRYPLDKGKDFRDNQGCWLSPAPSSLFVFSTDSVFSKPKYSRIVDSIDFQNLTEFRGGFVNSLDYNWFGDSDIKRDSMPFFVMYELTPSSVNCSLCWTGYLLWQDYSTGHYQPLFNSTKGCRKITSLDIGKKVFGVGINTKAQMGFMKWFGLLKSNLRAFFSPKRADYSPPEAKESFFSMSLILSPFLRFFAFLKLFLEILGAFLVINLMVKADWKRFTLACLIIVIAASVVYLYCPQLFGQYFIHEGGEDGLTHEILGRRILTDALSGNWVSALRGGEDVFWNTPGFRYFRAVEKLFFGDTDFGNLAVVLILPYLLFGFLTNFISKKWSFWVVIVFLLGFIFNLREQKELGFTYWTYVMVVRGGWPDALAYTAFLGGLTLALRYVNTRSGAYLWYGFLAHFLFFITVFMRPQFCLAALIVVLYLAFVLFKAGRIKEVLLTWVAFLPVLFPLLHNYFFGAKLFPFTGAMSLAIDTPPSLYLGALRELMAFNFSGHDVHQIALHLKGMIGPWYRVIFLGAVFYLAFLKRRVPLNMRIIAVLCLSLHFVNLFIFATYFRYVLLAWALTVVVAIFLIWLWFVEWKEKKGAHI